MGLDIYLMSKADVADEESRRSLTDELWKAKEAGEVTDEQYKERRAEIDATLPSRWADEVQARHASKAWPDYWMNRRYLRSSYNDGGFNNAVPQLLAGTELEGESSFYDIFAGVHTDDEYEIVLTPENDAVSKLTAAAGKARRIAEALRLSRDGVPPLRALTEAPVVAPTSTPAAAIEWTREALAKALVAEGGFGAGGYSSRDGFFTGKEGLKIYGIVFGKDVLGRTAVHLVYDAGEAVEDYARAADVAAEFAEEAIELVKNEGIAYIHWSG